MPHSPNERSMHQREPLTRQFFPSFRGLRLTHVGLVVLRMRVATAAENDSMTSSASGDQSNVRAASKPQSLESSLSLPHCNRITCRPPRECVRGSSVNLDRDAAVVGLAEVSYSCHWSIENPLRSSSARFSVCLSQRFHRRRMSTVLANSRITA